MYTMCFVVTVNLRHTKSKSNQNAYCSMKGVHHILFITHSEIPQTRITYTDIMLKWHLMTQLFNIWRFSDILKQSLIRSEFTLAV